jgi:hypothetical protein
MLLLIFVFQQASLFCSRQTGRYDHPPTLKITVKSGNWYSYLFHIFPQPCRIGITIPISQMEDGASERGDLWSYNQKVAMSAWEPRYLNSLLTPYLSPPISESCCLG